MYTEGNIWFIYMEYKSVYRLIKINFINFVLTLKNLKLLFNQLQDLSLLLQEHRKLSYDVFALTLFYN